METLISGEFVEDSGSWISYPGLGHSGATRTAQATPTSTGHWRFENVPHGIYNMLSSYSFWGVQSSNIKTRVLDEGGGLIAQFESDQSENSNDKLVGYHWFETQKTGVELSGTVIVEISSEGIDNVFVFADAWMLDLVELINDEIDTSKADAIDEIDAAVAALARAKSLLLA